MSLIKADNQLKKVLHRKRLRYGGFSLIEVMVAIAVVGIGLLALIAVMVTGTQSNQHGADLSKATYYARKMVETIRQDQDGIVFANLPALPNAASGINDPDGVFVKMNTTPPAKFSQIRSPLLDANGNTVVDGGGLPVPDPGDDKFERNIQIRRVSNVPTAYNYNVMQVDVTVRWQGGKAGDGMRKVKISSFLKAGA